MLPGAEGQSRTADTVIFSHVLYHLSYLGQPAHSRIASNECQGGES
jgi:hypothetical protein